METLTYTVTNKTFEYENDTTVITGVVSLGPLTNFYATGSVSEKVESGNLNYKGSFRLSKDGVRKMVHIEDTELANVTAVVNGIETILQKFIEDGSFIEETPEPLAEN